MNTFTDIEGARSHFPENTIEAFDAALDGGANALETDVHLTRDGQVVVFHDATGHRIAGVHAAIASVDLQHALNWDVGFQFETAHGTRPFQNAGFRMPLLKEVLLRYPGVRLNIDIKPGPHAVQAVVDTVRQHGNPGDVLLSGFEERVPAELRRQGYEGPVGMGKSAVIQFLAMPSLMLQGKWAAGTRLQIPPNLGPLSLGTKTTIGKAHRLGLRVDFWTINDGKQARKLTDRGANGIMSDHPGAMVRALGLPGT